MAPLQSQPEVQDAKNQQEAVSPESQRRSLLMVVFVLCLLLVVETFAATCIGAVAIKPRTVAFALLHRSAGVTPMEQAIIFQIRLPRAVADAPPLSPCCWPAWLWERCWATQPRL